MQNNIPAPANSSNLPSNAILVEHSDAGEVIKIEARENGVKYITELANNGKSGDARVTVYQFGEVRVADTNGDPVWEEADRAEFRELLESEGIDLLDGLTGRASK